MELATGEKELYDLNGTVTQPADSDELVNRAGDPNYTAVEAGLSAQLGALKGSATLRRVASTPPITPADQAAEDLD